MYNTLSLLLICSLTSPHHMGPRHMGMGPDNSVGMGHANNFQDNNRSVLWPSEHYQYYW